MFVIKTQKNNGIAIENAERKFKMEFSPADGEGFVHIGHTSHRYSVDGLYHILDWSLDFGKGAGLVAIDNESNEPYIEFARVPASVKGVFALIKSPAGDRIIIDDEDIVVLREFCEEAIHLTVAKTCEEEEEDEVNAVDIDDEDDVEKIIGTLRKVLNGKNARVVKDGKGVHIYTEDDYEDGPLDDFLDEVDVESEIIGVPCKQVYNAYRQLCEDVGCNPMTQNAFGRQLRKELGVTPAPVWRDGKAQRVYQFE